MPDTYGTVAEFPTDKTCQLIRQMLAENGIDSVTVYRIASTGPVYGVATEIRDVKEAKKLIDRVLGRDTTKFYDWNDY